MEEEGNDREDKNHGDDDDQIPQAVIDEILAFNNRQSRPEVDPGKMQLGQGLVQELVQEQMSTKIAEQQADVNE